MASPTVLDRCRPCLNRDELDLFGSASNAGAFDSLLSCELTSYLVEPLFSSCVADDTAVVLGVIGLLLE